MARSSSGGATAQRPRTWRWWAAATALGLASVLALGISLTTLRRQVNLRWQNLENQIEAVNRDHTSLEDQKRLLQEAFQDLTTYRTLQFWSAVLAALLAYAATATALIALRLARRTAARPPDAELLQQSQDRLEDSA